MQVQSIGREDALEKEMATHTSILAIDRGAWWAQSMGSQKSWTRLSENAKTLLNLPWMILVNAIHKATTRHSCRPTDISGNSQHETKQRNLNTTRKTLKASKFKELKLSLLEDSLQISLLVILYMILYTDILRLLWKKTVPQVVCRLRWTGMLGTPHPERQLERGEWRMSFRSETWPLENAYLRVEEEERGEK